MKVLLITHIEPVIHGQAMMASQLMELSKAWRDVSLLSLNTVYAADRSELGSGSLKKLLKLKCYTDEAVQLIKQNAIECVILTPAFLAGPFLKDAWMISALKRRTNVKVIAWVHMDPWRLEYDKRNWLFKRVIRGVVAKVDLWVACAESLHQQWPNFIKGEKAAVANGVDVAQTQTSQASRDVVRVVYLSAMDAQKGWEDLFAAAQNICAKRGEVEFHFYGGVAEQKEASLVKIFEESAYCDRVKWHGTVEGDRKNAALAAADIFVMPSHTEQFSLALLEAMAFGLPVVATNVGAVEEALPSQELLAPRDVVALERQITLLLEDAALRQRKGLENKQRYEALFTSRHFSENWRRLLLVFLAGNETSKKNEDC